MLITNDFIFYFESEDTRTLFESIYGENWQEKVFRKQHFCFKDDTFLSIYPDGSKPKKVQKYFESFMLGFIFLNEIDQNRHETIQTSSTMLGLVAQTCLAISEIMELPLELFFEDIDETDLDAAPLSDEDENPEEIALIIHDNWVKTGRATMNDFIQNGWVFPEKFDPTLIGEELIEGQNDFIIKPTDLFINSLDQFKIEEF